MSNNTKKSATKKTSTSSTKGEKIDKIEDVVIEEDTVKKVTSKKKEVTKKKAPKFELTDLILCKSVTGGELLFPSKKTGMLYVWSNFGDTCEVEYQDLRALKSTRSPYLYRPLFIIEDEDLVELWSKDLLPIYTKFAGLEDIDDFFNLPVDEFERKLREVPVGVQGAIKTFASEKIQNGTFDSNNKINILDEILGTDLKIYLK